jgi:AraC-like DNA-binding protein
MKVCYEKIPYPDGMSFACLAYEGAGCRNPLHAHPEFELTHFAHARGQWIAGDAMGELHDDFVAMFGAGLPHLFRPDMTRPRPVARVLQFRRDCLGAGFWDLPENRAIRGLLERAHRGLLFRGKWGARLCALLAGLIKTAPEKRLPAFLETLEIAAAAPVGGRGCRFLAGAGYQSALMPGEAMRINKVIDYVNARLCGEIYLADAARVAGLSEAAFSRFFHRTVKKTFTRFLNESRVSRACRRLMETDATVSEIAFACGFGNLSSFNRRFLELRGEPPTAFRRRRQQFAGAKPGREHEFQPRFLTER